MRKNENSLCFSGHRSEKLPQSKEMLERLKLRVGEEIAKAMEGGIEIFYFGACYGFDLLCADIVLGRKKVIQIRKPKIISLIAVLPYEEQAKYWKEESREVYFSILAQCDEVITLSAKYHRGCYHERNRYMVEHSSKMICYFDGGKGELHIL
ncbi:SLOG family protein [Anaerotignum sp.]|uniref:SLOG family protein n=1 Tax=Anaerotignum sp. TaxID=2039241 RepID=UPI0027153F94|nr:SLOG family protein [Anaerotignum sp.]